MHYNLPEKIRNLSPYEPICGDYPVRLDANESFFPFDTEALQAAMVTVSTNRYPDPYCAALCDAYGARYGIKADAQVVGNGSDELISLIMSCLLSKGDTVLSLSPDFSMYRFYPQIYELASVVLDKGPDLLADVEQIIQAAEACDASLLIFSNPCNPTSKLMTRADIMRLLDALSCLIVVDEAYMEFARDESVMDIAAKHPRLIVLKTFSKAMGMAALRLGVAIAGADIIRALKAAKSPYNVSALSQAAGLALLSDGERLNACTRAMIAQRDALMEGLAALSAAHPRMTLIQESQTNFAFVHMDGAAQVFEALKARGIIVRQMGEYLRITAGTEAEQRMLLDALTEVL